MAHRRTDSSQSLVPLLLFLCCHVVLGGQETSPLLSARLHGGHSLGRVEGALQALSASSCPAPPSSENETSMFPPDLFTQEQLAAGWVALPVLGVLYMFLALALICDNYFVPSLDVLIEEFSLAPDVAGATFMAAGGSAPELFISIIGVFITQSDVGIGTIVGSAVFNVLFVIAACAFASATALQLTAWPLLRDTGFYSVALGLLVAFFLDDTIMWWEALILFLWYGVYVTFMTFNSAAEAKVTSWMPSLARVGGEEQKEAIPGGIRGLRGKVGLMAQMHEAVVGPRGAGDQGGVGLRGLREVLGVQEQEQEVVTVTVEGEVVVEDTAVEKTEWQNPVTSGLKGGLASKCLCLLSVPLTLPMAVTVPDPQRPGWRSYYPLTFLLSILWISAFSYLIVWWATIICTVTGISEATMGITFLAAGTSVPDLITSVLVAKAGHGDMAVSSSIGSNLFDVTVGLPLPWLVHSLVFLEPSVSVVSTGMACNIGMLFVMLLAVILSIILFRWRMTKAMGAVMMVLYLVFLSVALSLAQCWISCFV